MSATPFGESDARRALGFGIGMARPACAPSKVHEPASPENIRLRELFAASYPRIVSGEVYGEGRRARQNGQPISACPWLEGSPPHEEWCAGWRGSGSEWAGVERRAA